MKRLALFAVAIGFALSTHSTATAPPTGVQLLEQCQVAIKDTPDTTESEATSAMHCLAYLSGVLNTYRFWEDENNIAKGRVPPPACIPVNATIFELAKVVVKYLNDHPNRLHESYSSLVNLALEDGYPCRSR